jgi:hypothetical protein
MKMERPVYVHIHAPQPDEWGISRYSCTTCGKRRFMLWRHTEWYGVDLTCLRCGESWSDGQRCERPFAPRWRQQSIEAARKLYRRLRLTPNDQVKGRRQASL